jgi:hypothetical protein
MFDLNELNQSSRKSIPQQANFQAMLESLSAPTREIVEALLREDVTPALIRKASQATPEEFRRYTFLRALDGGNPSPEATAQLTSVVLGFLMGGIDEFWEYVDEEE